MDDSIRFSLDGDRYLLVQGRLSQRTQPEMEMVAGREAEHVLRHAMHRGLLTRALHSSTRDCDTRGGWDDEVSIGRGFEALVKARAGGIILLREQRPRVSSLVLDVTEDEISDLLPADALLATTWIEVQLVDEDERPLAGLECEVEHPDGSTHRGKTDRDGILRYDGIPRGVCKVRLPSEATTLWMPA